QRFSIFRTSPRAEIVRPEAERGDAPVTLLRPVPAGPAGAREASVWTPVQRVSAEVPVTSTPGERGGAGPGPAGAVRGKAQVIPGAPPGTPAERRLPDPPVRPGAAGKLPAVGPPPVVDKRGTGYPDLPQPIITHPVEAPREGSKRAL